jgi:hypothetical protein
VLFQQFTSEGVSVMTEPELHWTGASGKKYGYWSNELPYSCKPNQNGNYIFAKLVNNVWEPVYIGQGDINDRVNDETHYNCAVAKGATHVHVHTRSTEKDRIAEEQDLLAGHPIAYAPVGCNEKVGG